MVDYIQAGELGLAFAVVVLSASLVLYVLRTSTAREEKLMTLLMKLQPLLEDIDRRIENIETGMRKPPRKKKL